MSLPVASRRLTWLAVALVVLLAGVSATAGAAAVRADCDVDAGAVVLQPQKGSLDLPAHAIWLDDRRLRWPGVSADGRFRLYYSRNAQIIAAIGARVRGADGAIDVDVDTTTLPETLSQNFAHLGNGVALRVRSADQKQTDRALRMPHVLVREDVNGRLMDVTATQDGAALDARYADAAEHVPLGARLVDGHSEFALWAPTARAVSLCLYPTPMGPASNLLPTQVDTVSGVWRTQRKVDLSNTYYRWLVEVWVPGVGIVRNRVTDPYSVSLNADSARSWIGALDAAELKPAGWDDTPVPPLAAQTDMSIYELHVRDFSINDGSVSEAHRGKYLAFTEPGSRGMQHLRALAQAGMTDVHLLPVFDFSTVPELGCVTPTSVGTPDGPTQQAAVTAVKSRDCFNWGYDPWHYGAPEGSYATDADDAAVRVRELRAAVMALHRAGLRVGMDVVYNHTSASGQAPTSVLDRIVPGYYQRLDANGVVENSTCCANTATERRMMGKLLIDTMLRWARDYRIDSFRFDLMGHQPRALMETLQRRLRGDLGRDVPLIGEGWNFGEVADGRRFVQASQLSLNGSHIGTFSDRARDALRGGSAGDDGDRQVAAQGYLNGLVYAPNRLAPRDIDAQQLMRAADLVRAGLAGSLRDYTLQTFDDRSLPLERIAYGSQPAGYVSEPDEVVNYVENHDNQTLFDIGVFKLPHGTTREDRARVQILGAAFVAFSQGIAYFHAGIDPLRSKSLDRNSYDSGDAFNRLDWSYQDNDYAAGLPPQTDNAASWDLMRTLLADASIKPTPSDIAWTRDAFRDVLRIRASSSLFRMRSAAEIKARLHFLNTGSRQVPTVIVGHLDGAGYPGAKFREVLYLVNVDTRSHTLTLPTERGKHYILHPVHSAAGAADRRPAKNAGIETAPGRFLIPSRTAMVYVIE
ncbi:MAG: alpha-1,6-glucosidase domain-containing protein [Tahibacter sp.]